ncbi:MAG TPA: hypothetical protein VGN72_09105 [Tepidisphaeraceae bacterium]|nr:hypothetical protein [Tepidisphaeraceae bacterium]
MEDMLGWPWVFLWYGGGYSSEVVILWPYLLFDVTLLAGLALATGHAACRITRRSSGPVTIVN